MNKKCVGALVERGCESLINKGIAKVISGSNPPLLIIKTIKVTKAILLTRRKYKIVVEERLRGAACTK